MTHAIETSLPPKSDPTAFLAATGCGFVAALLAIYIHLMLYKHADMSVYTWMAYGILPAGAFLLGIFVAGGYYIGASLTHYQSSIWLLLCMVLIAMFAQTGMYFVEYLDSRPDDYVISLDSFIRYVDSKLTESVYVFSGGGNESVSIAVGEFGYVLAAIQLAGFMVGSLTCFFALRGRNSCKKCRKYLKYKGAIRRYFETGTALEICLRHLDEVPEFSRQWVDTLRNEGTKKILTHIGVRGLSMVLYECPACKDQVVEQDVQISGHRHWHTDYNLERRRPVPQGMDLKDAFKKKQDVV